MLVSRQHPSNLPAAVDSLMGLWGRVTAEGHHKVIFCCPAACCDPAGHYVPAVSDHIFRVNKKLAPDSKIPLKGFAVGNGLTDPAIQYNAYGEDSLPCPPIDVICLLTVCFRPAGDFALVNKLISPATRSNMARIYPLCRVGVQLCNSINLGFICELALAVCQNTQFAPVIMLNPGINVSNIAAHPCQAVKARQ